MVNTTFFVLSFNFNDFNKAIVNVDRMLGESLSMANPNHDPNLYFMLKVKLEWRRSSWLRSRSEGITLSWNGIANWLRPLYIGEAIANSASQHDPKNLPSNITVEVRVSHLKRWVMRRPAPSQGRVVEPGEVDLLDPDSPHFDQDLWDQTFGNGH